MKLLAQVQEPECYGEGGGLTRATAKSERPMPSATHNAPYAARSSYDAPSILHIPVPPEYRANMLLFDQSYLHRPGRMPVAIDSGLRPRMNRSDHEGGKNQAHRGDIAGSTREDHRVWVAMRLALPKRRRTTSAQATMLSGNELRDSQGRLCVTCSLSWTYQAASIHPPAPPPWSVWYRGKKHEHRRQSACQPL